MKTKNKKIFLRCLAFSAIGTVAGFINGFFGAGGGLLLVPMITYAGKTEPKVAHATTLGSVLFMCLGSSIIYIAKRQFDLKFVIVCMIGSVIGSLIGTKLLKKLKNNIIDLIFAIILVLAGVFMIIF